MLEPNSQARWLLIGAVTISLLRLGLWLPLGLMCVKWMLPAPVVVLVAIIIILAGIECVAIFRVVVLLQRISHDYRSSLAGIRSLAELLATDARADQANYLAVMIARVDELLGGKP